MEEFYKTEQILNEVQTISESYNRVSEATGENFNIFSILQMESDEVATHSRFIAELLNRKGRHGQKDKFLCLFLNRFAKDYSLQPDKSQIFVEYHVGKVEIENGGRLDILIKDHVGNAIMIENKIYAGEQFNQLLRYHNAFPNGKLFYLTLFGNDSNQMSSKNIYENISYEVDIINWLEECRKESVNIPILRETISQYINLLKKLTNQNLNKKMNQDIIDRILRDKNSLTSYKILFDVHKDLKKEIIKKIIDNMKALFERKGFLNIQTLNLDDDRGRLISFQTEKLISHNLTLQLNFEGSNYSNLIIGFVNKSPKQPKDFILLELVRKEFPKAKQSDWWNVYVHYDNYRDWYFATLNNIYFDSDNSFYRDLENKVDRLIEIINNK